MTAASELPLALTMGDACGIGPEIIAKLFQSRDAAGCVVIGNVDVMRRAATSIGGGLAVARCERARDALEVPSGSIPVLQVDGLPKDLMQARVGQADARAGSAAARCIERAVALALAGEIAAIVTAPIHKEALAAAGVGYPGHTEMLQVLAAAPAALPAGSERRDPPGGGRSDLRGGTHGEPLPPVRMMLANGELRTVLVTVHMALRDAIDAVTFDAVLQTIRIAHTSAARWGMTAPRIAVAGLNPHAGEGGLFGDEELRIIAPAVRAARAEGMDVHGPFAPDTVFMRARNAPDHRGEFDIVIAMTHDHGLIPVKYLGVEHGVNVTLGLPFVRTSPDHGTAFDIAGTGRADPSSLRAALRMARELASRAATGGSTS